MTRSHIADRDQTLDIARGIAIIMIVLGHVLRGMVAANLIRPDAGWYVLADQLLYSVHLGVFAFVSGLFVGRGVDRDGIGRYLRQRDVTFLWLYVLWSLLQGAVKLAAASSVNSSSTFGMILNLSHPQGQLWFLPWLIVVTSLAAISGIWRDSRRAYAGLAIALVVSILGWGTDPGIAGAQGLGLWVFFTAGVALQAEPVVALVRRTTAGSAAVVAVVTLGGYVAIVVSRSASAPTPSALELPTPLAAVVGLVATTVGICGVLAVSRLLAIVGPPWLGIAGRRSLEIFLASITFASGIRIVLAHFGVDSVVVHVAVGTLFGVAGPILLAVVGERVRARWLFAAPRVLTQGV